MIDLVGRYYNGLPDLEMMNKKIGELFANMLIGNSANPSGFVYILTQPHIDDPLFADASKLATGFTFEEIDGEVYFVIRHNPKVGLIDVLSALGSLLNIIPTD